MSLKRDLTVALGGEVEERVDLSLRTSVRVGGPAQFFASPSTPQALARALDACAQHAVPYAVLGAGSNTLVSDAGVAGLVLRLGHTLVPERAVVEGQSGLFTLGAGAPMVRLIALARANNCVGMEFWVGIPGTVGGGVVMNAGTREGSTERICEEVGLAEPGRVRALAANEVGFAYRRTELPERAVVTWARFRLPVGEPAEVLRSRQTMDEDLAARRRTQPLNLPNSGSVFRNPEGDHAGRLIDACALKGLTEGGAQISTLHANFIVNRGGASAADVLRLMRRMQDAVLERFGARLIPEVKLLGEVDPALLPRGLRSREDPAA
jgi:UDP-N-acetylmuramate dehydrogenase